MTLPDWAVLTRRAQAPQPHTDLTVLPDERTARLDSTRRRAYLSINLVGMVVQAVVWISEVLHPSGDLGTLYFNPVFFVMCGFFAVWLLKGRPLALTERVGLAVFAVMLVFRLLTIPLTSSSYFFEQLQTTYWLVMIASVISFLVFDFRQALLGSLALYAASVAVPWLLWYGVTPPGGAGVVSAALASGAARLLQLQLLPGIALMIMWSLAWYREHFVLERQLVDLTEKLAHTDALTGLNNRRALYPHLACAAQQDAPASVLLLDIDHFKAVNDQHGHNVGDAVLVQVAATLRAALPAGAVLGRWGGEEFLLLLPAAQPQAAALARALGQHLAGLKVATAGHITVSIGVAQFGAKESLHACLSRADRALYQAKQQGRNRVCAAGPKAADEAEPSAEERMPVAPDLPLAATLL